MVPSRRKVLAVALVALVAPLALGAALLRPVYGADVLVAPPPPPLVAFRVIGPAVYSACDFEPTLEMVVDTDVIRVGPNWDTMTVIPRTDAGWASLRHVLTRLKTHELFVEHPYVRVAVGGSGAAPVPYADLIRALEIAQAAGFDHPEVRPANTLRQPPPGVRRTGFPGPFLDVCQSLPERMPEHSPRDGLVASSAAC